MSGKADKAVARLREELAERRRRTAELELSLGRFRQLVEELRSSGEMFRSMADSANDAIIVLDDRGIVSYINQASYEPAWLNRSLIDVYLKEISFTSRVE